MKCTTVLHGGVCHRTSTPHKSGNKMMRKKNFGGIGVNQSTCTGQRLSRSMFRLSLKLCDGKRCGIVINFEMDVQHNNYIVYKKHIFTISLMCLKTGVFTMMHMTSTNPVKYNTLNMRAQPIHIHFLK